MKQLYKRTKNKALWLHIWITQSCRDFNFVVIYAFLLHNSNSKIFWVHKKFFISSLSLFSAYPTPWPQHFILLWLPGFINATHFTQAGFLVKSFYYQEMNKLCPNRNFNELQKFLNYTFTVQISISKIFDGENTMVKNNYGWFYSR